MGTTCPHSTFSLRKISTSQAFYRHISYLFMLENVQIQRLSPSSIQEPAAYVALFCNGVACSAEHSPARFPHLLWVV